jgi:hypothetical protein
VRPTLLYSYQYGRYIPNAFIKFNLFQSGSRRELVTLFNPKFFSQKLTFQKEMTTIGGEGGGGECMKEIGTIPNGLQKKGTDTQHSRKRDVSIDSEITGRLPYGSPFSSLNC